MQAACGLAQLQALPDFIATRKRNFNALYQRLKDYQDFFILPETTKGSKPSWFGFPLTIRDSSIINRLELLLYLNEKKIGTRLLFGGNLVRQPYFDGVTYRVFGSLEGTEKIAHDTFWLGLFHGISPDEIDYSCDSITDYVSQKI